MTSKPTFWMVEEAVGGGHYIVLPGIFTHQEDAEDAFPEGGECRAMEYQRGYDGPERVPS